MALSKLFPLRLGSILSSRPKSTLTALPSAKASTQTVLQKRLDAWNETHKQRITAAMAPYVEKINVEYVGSIGESCSLQMTKRISCPIDCAKHLSKLLVDRSAIALVDGEPWDMHRPLLQDCSVDFVHFKDVHHDPVVANRAFWRSASFLLAATLETAFRPEHSVRLLCNWPTEPEHGSFVCDIVFTPTRVESSSSNPVPWVPSKRELDALSTHGQRLSSQASDFIPLHVLGTHPLCEACFADNRTRRRQLLLEFGAEDENSLFSSAVSIYRMGNFVEACGGGPLISSSRMIGKFAVTQFYPLGWLYGHAPSTEHPNGILVYRVHGLAIPAAFPTHFTTFERLVHWSCQPNPAVPVQPDYAVPL